MAPVPQDRPAKPHKRVEAELLSLCLVKQGEAGGQSPGTQRRWLVGHAECCPSVTSGKWEGWSSQVVPIG